MNGKWHERLQISGSAAVGGCCTIVKESECFDILAMVSGLQSYSHTFGFIRQSQITSRGEAGGTRRSVTITSRAESFGAASTKRVADDKMSAS